METEVSLSDLSEDYTEKRLLHEQEKIPATITEFRAEGVDENLEIDTISDIDTLLVQFEIANKSYYTEFNVSDFETTSTEHKLVHFFKEIGYVDSSNLQSILNTTIEIQLNEKISAFTISSDISYNLQKGSIVSNQELFPSEFTLLKSLISYSQSDPLRDGWLKEITNIKPISDNKFKLYVGVHENITFKLEVPDNANPTENPVSRLIEQTGGGRLDFLEDSYVYLIHSEDVPDELRTITTSTDGMWVLATEPDFEQFKSEYIESQNTVYSQDSEQTYLANRKQYSDNSTESSKNNTITGKSTIINQISSKINPDPQLSFHTFIMILALAIIEITVPPTVLEFTLIQNLILVTKYLYSSLFILSLTVGGHFRTQRW